MSQLAAQLEADTLPVAEDDFIWLRYMNDQRFAWLIVVPKQPNLREWYELSPTDQSRLLTRVNQLAQQLQDITQADKMNLGALGNLVPQLHIHIIARRQGDACWPGSVWGQGQPQPYTNGDTPDWLATLQANL